MTTVEILKAARKLIGSEKSWTKRSFIGTRHDGAPCYCALGAIQTAAVSLGARAESGPGQEADRVVRDCLDPVFHRSIVTFNDYEQTTHSDVIALVDCAIAAAEARS